MLFLFFFCFFFHGILVAFCQIALLYFFGMVDHVNLVVIHYVMTCPDMAMALSIACVRE